MTNEQIEKEFNQHGVFVRGFINEEAWVLKPLWLVAFAFNRLMYLTALVFKFFGIRKKV